jgi:hypothetical protein
MNGEFPKGQADHENGIKDDNRWENLRDLTNEENASNRVRANTNNSLGFLGVHRCKNKFRAIFKGKCLGLYPTPEEAHAAYQRARSEYESTIR